MKLRKILGKAVLLMVFILIACFGKTWGSSITDDILKYTNEYRKSKGKPALVMDDAATKQAMQHASNMASGKTPFGHQGFAERVKALGSGSVFISAAAENVAYGYLSAREVVDGWIKSSVHRKNMLGNFTQIGIGVEKAKDGNLYFVQLFIKK
jgi:uncharacterized protein YkwD